MILTNLNPITAHSIADIEKMISMLEGKPIQLVPLIKHSGQIDPNSIKHSVSAVLQVSVPDMESKTRRREVVEARYIAIDLIMEMLPTMSLRECGELFGNRDHSSIIHAQQTVRDQLTCSRIFRHKYHNVMTIIDASFNRYTLTPNYNNQI